MKKIVSMAFSFALLVVLVTGCGPKKKDDHDHNGEKPPPHGGELFAPKGQHTYHVELVIKKDKPAVMYIYDENVDKLVPTDAKKFVLTIKGDKGGTIDFMPEPQEKDPAGKSSKFVAAFDKLPTGLDYDDEEVHKKMEITGDIDGKTWHFEAEDH